MNKMRKLILIGIIAIVAISATFIGCSTNDIEQIETTEITLKDVTTPADPTWGIKRIWNGVDACVPPPVNCFDDVVVTPEKEGIRGLIQEIKLQRDITIYVDQNFTELKSIISEIHLINLLNGRLQLSIVENTSINTYFIIFTDKVSNEINVVYPFVLK